MTTRPEPAAAPAPGEGRVSARPPSADDVAPARRTTGDVLHKAVFLLLAPTDVPVPYELRLALAPWLQTEADRQDLFAARQMKPPCQHAFAVAVAVLRLAGHPTPIPPTPGADQ